MGGGFYSGGGFYPGVGFLRRKPKKRPINTNMEVRGTLVFLEMVYVYC